MIRVRAAVAAERELFHLAVLRVRRVVEVVHGDTALAAAQRKPVAGGQCGECTCLVFQRARLVHNHLRRATRLVALERNDLAFCGRHNDERPDHVHRIRALGQVKRGDQRRLRLDLPHLHSQHETQTTGHVP